MIALTLVALALTLPPLPAAESAGFRRERTKLWTIPQGPANHRGRDAVVAVGQPQWAIGKFAYGPSDKDLKEEDVEIFILEPRGTSTAWVCHGTVRTSREGEHEAVDGVSDDGGRVFAPIAPALPVGRHAVAMRVLGDGSRAECVITVVHANTAAVLFDIDGTLTTDDGQILKQLETAGSDEPHVPAVRPGASAVANRWAELGYLVVYVSARPDNLQAITHDWLEDQGFPPGPLVLTDHVREAIPGSHVAGFKARALARLRSLGGLRFVAAYGNADTDIDVYLAASIPQSSVYIVGPLAGTRGTTAVDFATHLPALAKRPRADVAAPPASGW